MINLDKEVWVFHGAGGQFSSGVFSSLVNAEHWIKEYSLTGILTKYPLDEGIYNWAIRNNYFEIKKDSQLDASFIQKFSSASQEHYHFEDGEMDS